MTFNQIMASLQAMGTAQNVKIYRRHGATDPLYGVSFANLNKLKKQIKVDHALAVQLWNSGNADARHLATMVADPAQITAKLADQWVRDLRYCSLGDLFTGLICRTTLVQTKAGNWMDHDGEWIARAGWMLQARLAMADAPLSDAYFEKLLRRIEREIPTAKNRVKDAMNSAVIAIGLRNRALEKKAIAAAKKIGKVEVDHGETGCKTPDAIAYIGKAKAHRSKKAQRRAKAAS